ncbi:hypothetical protein EYR40_009116 [Pleurotus pulmonarius]|nr:hypothetical protein EYR40_009116 [Pleurotus pulmonarius]
MRAALEGDDSEFTDDGYQYEHESEITCYRKNTSRVEHTIGKDDSGDEQSSEYDDSDSEDSGADDSDGDTSASDSSGEDLGYSEDDEASDGPSGAAHSVEPCEASANLTNSAKKAVVTSPIISVALTEKVEKGTVLHSTSMPSDIPVTPTKPRQSSCASQLSPQRRQGPMRVVSPPSSAKASIERASKASASVFSKEM